MLALQLEEYAAAVGRDLHRACRGLLRRSAFSGNTHMDAAVHAVKTDRREALACRYKNAIRVVREMRESAALCRRDMDRGAAIRRNVPQVGARRTAGTGDLTLAFVLAVKDLFLGRGVFVVLANISVKLIIDRSRNEHDLGTVRRVHRVRIERG